MILAGMIFGDIFAVFILHQNASRVGDSLSAAAHAAVAGDIAGVGSAFQKTGGFLENRGTKVDTHAHLIGFGYLALMLAILQPSVALAERTKQRLAWLFLFGGILLPLGVFLIHYIGLAHSPLQAIGWASIFADLGGLFVLLASLAYLAGLCRRLAKTARMQVQDDLLAVRTSPGRALLLGGTLLVLVGFVHGAYYAGIHLYAHEAADYNLLAQMTSAAAVQDMAHVDQALAGYGRLQGEKAVNIAAHAHLIEFGILALLLGFFAPYISLNHRWQRRWANLLLLGSALLPVCVLLELKFGLLAGGIADLGGLLVIVALFAMWIGIFRYTGSIDAGALPLPSRALIPAMSNAKRILIFGGITLAIVGMAYGLWYAVFAEHQALNGIGSSLASSFSAAAQRNTSAAGQSLLDYREAKYRYDRQVDVHGHWIGLALLLIVLGIAADRISPSPKISALFALALLAGSAFFPLAVLVETWSHGPLPRAVAVAASALAIAALSAMTVALYRNPTSIE